MKKYAVDVHWTVARTYEVTASSREEAEEQMLARIARGEVCVWTDGFEATEEVECSCHGEENPATGEIEFD